LSLCGETRRSHEGSPNVPQQCKNNTALCPSGMTRGCLDAEERNQIIANVANTRSAMRLAIVGVEVRRNGSGRHSRLRELKDENYLINRCMLDMSLENRALERWDRKKSTPAAIGILFY
jgi:hypothetical protein